MSQSRKGSLAEALVNVAVGLGVSCTANALIFPLYGWHISAGQNISIGLIFTAISIVRSYMLRRYFNWRTVRQAQAAKAPL